jgi:hypothetical protein
MKDQPNQPEKLEQEKKPDGKSAQVQKIDVGRGGALDFRRFGRGRFGKARYNRKLNRKRSSDGGQLPHREALPQD